MPPSPTLIRYNLSFLLKKKQISSKPLQKYSNDAERFNPSEITFFAPSEILISWGVGRGWVGVDIKWTGLVTATWQKAGDYPKMGYCTKNLYAAVEDQEPT